MGNYVLYRPGYPKELLELLARECGLMPDSRIADIGSGTGLLSALLLESGCEVFGVEPNREMRLAGEQALAGQARFHSVDGRSEATTLADGSIDIVTAAQAFHWFEPEATRAEFRRILKPEGWVVLVWNERAKIPGLMTEYEELVRGYAAERPHVKGEELDRFFATWRLEVLPNSQELDLEGFRGDFCLLRSRRCRGKSITKMLWLELRLFSASISRTAGCAWRTIPRCISASSRDETN